MKPRGLFDLGRHVAAQQDAWLERTASDADIRREVVRCVEQRRRAGARRAPRLRLMSWVAAAALLPGLAWGIHGLLTTEGNVDPLRFTVGGREGVLRAWERAPTSDDLSIDFSDGSTFRLAPRARARVVGVDSQGANVVVESGRLRASVVPQPGGVPRRWHIQSGPFEVEVKGTRFELGWNPEDEEFVLQLFEGKVKISGCALGDGVEVRAHQEVRASCRRTQFELRDMGDGRSSDEQHPPRALDPTAASSPPSSVASPDDPPSLQSTRSGDATLAPSRATARRWVAFARRGQFNEAYDLAEPIFAIECDKARITEVLLLADAARHSGQGEAARHAYLAVRRRAPGTASAAEAAFELGRLEFEHDPEAASRWFESSLAERPHGRLAQAALDRLLEAAVRIGDAGRLRRLASRYLEVFPQGPRARDAREIVESDESRR